MCWSESSLGAHVILLVLSCWRGSSCKRCLFYLSSFTETPSFNANRVDPNLCCLIWGYTVCQCYMDRVKQIWFLSPMRAAKVQASLRIRAVSPEPSLLAHTSSESRGTFRQKARSLVLLNGWAWAVKICHDGMLKDINSLDGAHISWYVNILCIFHSVPYWICKLYAKMYILIDIQRF